MSDGYLPELRDLGDEAFRQVMEELQGSVRLRCAMPEFVVTGRVGWKHQPVTYCHRISISGISEERATQLYHDACASWNAVAAVNLKYTQDFDSANIFARSGKIDGSSGTLAWSYLPQNVTAKSRLEQLYESGEKWTAGWFLEVAIHELGHALGLEHSSDKADIMYPYSAGGQMDRPQPGDVRRIRALGYDAPATPPVPTPAAEISGVIVVNGIAYGINGVAQ